MPGTRTSIVVRVEYLGLIERNIAEYKPLLYCSYQTIHMYRWCDWYYIICLLNLAAKFRIEVFQSIVRYVLTSVRFCRPLFHQHESYGQCISVRIPKRFCIGMYRKLHRNSLTFHISISFAYWPHSRCCIAFERSIFDVIMHRYEFNVTLTICHEFYMRLLLYTGISKCANVC